MANQNLRALVGIFRGNFSRTTTVLFLGVAVGRILLSLVTPLFSTDFQRNLFYGQAFWSHGFSVYDLSPIQIDPNYNIIDPSTQTFAYPSTSYDYPSLQLIFWALISLFPLQMILAKVVLLGVDCLNVLIINKMLESSLSKVETIAVPMAYFLPMTIIASIEGQVEGITVFIMLLTVKLIASRPTLAFTFAAIGLHWKYVPVLCLPYLIARTWNRRPELAKGVIAFALVAVLLSFPLLVSSYVSRYVLYFGNLPNSQQPSNPLSFHYFPLEPWFLSSIALWIVLGWAVVHLARRPSEITDFLIALPLLVFLKYYRFAFPWYWVWLFPAVIVLREKPRQILWGSLILTFSIGTLDFVTLTAGWDYLFRFLFL